MTAPTYTIELEHIGEGYGGDYDPNDPHDEPLLRFTVLDVDGEAYDDASYCTHLPDTLTADERERAKSLMLERIVSSGESLKRTCESLSWLAPEDLR